MGDAESYSFHSYDVSRRSGDISLMLAFSGGGTRAAAFTYGVLEELRDTGVVSKGQSVRLLDEVDFISSVSGGSFTAAYYGLYGDQIFDDFEEVFLRRDVEGKLIRGVLNPLEWFKRTGRTEMAVGYYEKNVFHGATFGDMKRKGGPLVLINASDLGYGVRFSFIQEYFNLLCSDLSSFPVARAVTASSAVLKRLQKQNVAVEYIEKLLAAFSPTPRSPGLPVSPSPPACHAEAQSAKADLLFPPSPLPSVTPPLADPLTHRELDVLELLAQRLQNKEIADKLSISTITVKGHLQNIYGKLNVNKRLDAIEKAKKVGIL